MLFKWPRAPARDLNTVCGPPSSVIVSHRTGRSLPALLRSDRIDARELGSPTGLKKKKTNIPVLHVSKRMHEYVNVQKIFFVNWAVINHKNWKIVFKVDFWKKTIYPLYSIQWRDSLKIFWFFADYGLHTPKHPPVEKFINHEPLKSLRSITMINHCLRENDDLNE